jgi:hypothetical protein
MYSHHFLRPIEPLVVAQGTDPALPAGTAIHENLRIT